MANNRVYYATQAVALRPLRADGTANSAWYYPRGLQSVGITTNFGLTQVFQLGQLELYDNIEDVPEVEVTMSKNIDGTPPLYLIVNQGSAGFNGAAAGQELAALVNNRVNFRLGIYDDNKSAATGTPGAYVDCSGMYLSSIGYTFPTDGVATEDITLVGNHKVWNSGTADGYTYGFGAPNANGAFSNGSDAGTMTAPALARRFKVRLDESAFPTGVGGGIPIPGNRTVPSIQNISVNCDLGREAINEIGLMAPYFRYVTFPVEVTSEFEVISMSGDYVDADDFMPKAGETATCNKSYNNLQDKQIFITVCGSGANDKLSIDLGLKNKLTSVNYTGGDTGGGNATMTYSYQTFNKLVVHASGSFKEAKWIDNTNDTGVVGD
jgi:hypothetical protein